MEEVVMFGLIQKDRWEGRREACEITTTSPPTAAGRQRIEMKRRKKGKGGGW